MKERFSLLLDEFDNILQVYNPLNYARLYNPIADTHIEDSLITLKISDMDFRQFFKWKNGFDFKSEAGTNCQIFESGGMMSLESIIRKVKIHNTTQHIWDSKFIPIITDSKGQYILFNNKMGNNFGKLYFYSASILSAITPITCYDSLSTLIKTTIMAYQKGILKYDIDDDWLDIDRYSYNNLAQSMNPKSEFWKHK